jgi:hypothetical protein
VEGTPNSYPLCWRSVTHDEEEDLKDEEEDLKDEEEDL